MGRIKSGNMCKRGCLWYELYGLNPPSGPRSICLELPLVVRAETQFDGHIPAGLRITGRNLVGPVTAGGANCAGTDTYITYPGPITAIPYLEIWDAYRAGIWSSSVTIEVHVLAPINYNNIGIHVEYGDYGDAIQWGVTHGKLAAQKGLIKSTGTQNCASSSLVATITVTDTGIVTIA